MAASLAAAPTRVSLPTQQPTIVSLSQPKGATSPSTTIGLAISLPFRSQADAKQFLHDLYDRNSLSYHKYLTSAQFTARFGPTQTDYDAVIAFAKSQGLTVTKTFPERTLVDVSGPASAVQSAFAVALQDYESPSGHLFHAPVGTPSIPATLGGKIDAVVGMDNAEVRISNIRRQTDADPGLVPTMQQGTSIKGGLAPNDIRTAYNLTGLHLDGAGQTLAVFELDTYTPTDILRYERLFKLPIVPLENVLVDPTDPDFPSYPGSDTAEVVLDIDMQMALAPKAAKILVYIGPNTNQGVVDQYQQIATDDRATSISSSWAEFEDRYFLAYPPNVDAIADYVLPEAKAFAQMAMQGQTMFASAGDDGGVDPATGYLSPMDPSSQPYVCGVGGTTLTVRNPGLDEHHLHETTWDYDGNPTHGAGGGGVSYIWNFLDPQDPLDPTQSAKFAAVTPPDYQTAAVALAPANATVDLAYRNVPDVSLNADPNTGYVIYVTDPNTGPDFYIVGGTSAAAPLWAGFAALVNQQRANLGEGTIGFINPALYALGPGGEFAYRYPKDFNDIGDRSNNIPYLAVKGYDLATGLGTFKGASLIGDLATKF